MLADSITSLWQLIAIASATGLLYAGALVVYRLTLHPLASFPGPKIAAATRFYEAYWDLVQNGQYTFQIARLHKQYGPIIRISPHELHVNDPAFFNQLYRQDGRWDKYDWAVNASTSNGSALNTVDHYHHKSRRQVLNPFFSKASVAASEDCTRQHLAKLCSRIAEFAPTKDAEESVRTFNLGAAATAVIRDATHDLVLGKSCDDLDEDDFRAVMTGISNGLGKSWRMGKHIPWLKRLMKSMPRVWINATADQDIKVYLLHHVETVTNTARLMDAHASRAAGTEQPRTIVDDILDSKLPAGEKKFTRISQELSSIIGASFEPTANALRLGLFHIFSNPNILVQLRTELAAAKVSSLEDLTLVVLERLPYLTATVKETLRLSPGQATRMARVAPDRTISYGNWSIPVGTPVGMTVIMMQADERFCDNPREFIPDRWMDPDARQNLERIFAPFSKGTRSCLGRNLAMSNLYMVIATLVMHFDFEFPSAKAEDFECSSDQFAIGSTGGGMLLTKVKRQLM